MPEAPPAVLKRIKTLLNAPSYWPIASDEAVAALERLTSSLDMYPVWRALSDQSEPEYLPEEFLDACMIAMLQWNRISKTASQRLSKDLKAVARLATRLAQLLRVHDADLSLRNIPRTVAWLLRSEATRRIDGGVGIPADE